MASCSTSLMWGSVSFHATTEGNCRATSARSNRLRNDLINRARLSSSSAAFVELVSTVPADMSSHDSAASAFPSPRATLAQSMTTGPTGLMSTLPGWKSRWINCVPSSDRGGANPLGAGDVVKRVVQRTEHEAHPSDFPRTCAQQVEHRRSVYPLHDEFGLVVADLVDLGRGESVIAHVFHDARFD